jgi:transcriptional regulator with XRE-family HTH domain
VPRTQTSSLVNQLLGAQLREARVAVGRRQMDVAEDLGTTAAYLSNVEAGRVNLTVGQLHRIADAIGVEVQFAFDIPDAEEAFDLSSATASAVPVASDR